MDLNAQELRRDVLVVEAEVVDVAEAVRRAASADGESRIALRCEVGPTPARVLAAGLPRALELFLQRALEGTPRRVSVELQVRADGEKVFVNIAAPKGARIPDGWSIRTAIAIRIVDRCHGGHRLDRRRTVGEPQVASLAGVGSGPSAASQRRRRSVGEPGAIELGCREVIAHPAPAL